MTTVNYPSPVTVNGYSCKNCTDVDYAKKNIDPAHPKDGPYGVNAKPISAASSPKAQETPAVTFGGVLAGVSQTAKGNAPPTATQGLRLDVSA
jgi:hypothetical protein